MRRPNKPLRGFSGWVKAHYDDIMELYNNVVVKKIDLDFNSFVNYLYYHSD